VLQVHRTYQKPARHPFKDGLGHTIGGVKGTYNRHDYHSEKLRAYENLAALIETIVHPQPNVVALRA
jgi:hypothetical protein